MRIQGFVGTAALAAMFAVSGCGKKGGGAEKDFEGYVNAVCACKDMKCVGDEGTKFADKHKNDKKSGDSNAKPSKKMLELSAKMTGCNKKIMEEELKKTQGGPPAGGGDPVPPKAAPNWPKLTQEQCEKAARKKNIECRTKGTEAPKDEAEMIKMVSGACMAGNDMPDVGYVSQAQVACLDKADCKEWTDCVEKKETELKAELGK